MVAAGSRAGGVPRARKGGAGDGTKARIIAAALACLADEGIAGLSARAIARHGDFNQALIFYHFGSVDSLLVAASKQEAAERSARYADRLGEVTTLPELVAVAKELHETETESGSTAMLVQLMAGAASSDELRDGISDGFRPWMDLVEATVTRVLDGTPLAAVVPVTDVSLAIAALFLGMELINGLQPGSGRSDALFATLTTLGALVDSLLTLIPADAISRPPTGPA